MQYMLGGAFYMYMYMQKHVHVVASISGLKLSGITCVLLCPTVIQWVSSGGDVMVG